jgi:lipopolysaccharide/colanic/teichoic acid biosynthesis glycosyltransferase
MGVKLLLLLLLLLLFNGAPAHVGPRPPLMRFRNLTLIDNW